MFKNYGQGAGFRVQGEGARRNRWHSFSVRGLRTRSRGSRRQGTAPPAPPHDGFYRRANCCHMLRFINQCLQKPLALFSGAGSEKLRSFACGKLTFDDRVVLHDPTKEHHQRYHEPLALMLSAGFGVGGLGFRVQCSGYSVQGSEFRV